MNFFNNLKIRIIKNILSILYILGFFKNNMDMYNYYSELTFNKDRERVSIIRRIKNIYYRYKWKFIIKFFKSKCDLGQQYVDDEEINRIHPTFNIRFFLVKNNLLIKRLKEVEKRNTAKWRAFAKINIIQNREIDQIKVNRITRYMIRMLNISKGKKNYWKTK